MPRPRARSTRRSRQLSAEHLAVLLSGHDWFGLWTTDDDEPDIELMRQAWEAWRVQLSALHRQCCPRGTRPWAYYALDHPRARVPVALEWPHVTLPQVRAWYAGLRDA